MRVQLLCSALLFSQLVFAQHEGHAATAATTSPAGTTQSTGMSDMQSARQMSSQMHGGSLNYLLLAEKFEYSKTDNDKAYAWDLQGWVGGDINKAWFKTEGSYDTDANQTRDAEVQALFSRAIAPFWDLQAGIRHDDGAGASRNHAVLGVQGLAPYWFEVDAAAFLSDKGDLSTRLQAEYELRFTQKLLLQPRVELNYSFSDDFAADNYQGLSEASFGLRLRYEIRREFAPYAGVQWTRAYGKTGTALRLRGEDPEAVSVVAGVRFWY